MRRVRSFLTLYDNVLLFLTPIMLVLSSRISKRVGLPSLPEMVFGKNKFVLQEGTTGFSLEFTTEAALAEVSHIPPTDVKVAAAKTWTASNQGAVAKLKTQHEFTEDTSSQDFDWTFTTRYAGTFTPAPTIISEGLQHEKDGIPMAKLRSTTDPILWFSVVHLFEDELHDNGIADYATKARVMGNFWFCLVRFWLRVDGVLFRIIDHRYFHEFGTQHIIREMSTKQASWEEVTKKTNGDFRQIKDPDVFGPHLETISTQLEHIILPEISAQTK